MKFKFLIVFIFVSISTLSYAQEQLPDLPEDIKQQTQKRIDLGYHSGTVIGVVDKSGARYYGFGQKSFDDTSKPDEYSIFEIASITKPFTAALLADLELKGEIKINDAIEKYVPVFKQVLAKSNRTITLEDLLNHTSGLPRNPTNTKTEDSNRYKDYSVDDLNEYLSGYTMTNSTRTYRYSSLAYLPLELAIENRMNTTYEDLIKDRILKPLEMNDTYFVVPQNKRDRLIMPYRNGKQMPELDMGQFPAGGGIKTSPKDLIQFIKAQLDLYVTPLSEAFEMTHKERFSNKKETLGLAWSILRRKESGKTLIYHKGGSKGFVSFAGFNVEDQIGVVVLTNGIRYFSDLGFKILDPTYPLTIVQK
ncbi:hypothetical protein ATO12_14935 [Aquimarina atlantica]|uniref:Beta-lactamase-related domain-containing protein n=1 Tax=Aquimarina atlantica TaxID=1317122 RepID=A0A023BVV3_9FLAO|nr:serine hydrolase domain-containing protein [Aquimarina atlantica]EZH74162.1 hypothetical protein ATO12_14935 [Aquimarina atlantica]